MIIHAIIPARSGSKGVKNKNIVKINNKELIGYTIEFCKKIKFIDKIIVSTDSVKIKKIAEKFGAEVPFIRPKKYSKDSSKDLDVFKHYLEWQKKNNLKEPDIILHLRVTTPIRDIKIIKNAIKRFIKNKKASSLRSFRYSIFSPYKMWKFKNSKFVEPVVILKNNSESHSYGRQELPKTLNHIGVIDILRPKKTIYQDSMCGTRVMPLIFEKKDLKNYVDIDNNNDLKIAKQIIKKL